MSTALPAAPTEPTFYHGTRRGFTRGGWLIPRGSHGGTATTAPVTPGRAPAPDADQHIYLTTDLDLAWAYAWHAPGSGKPKILIVAPSGPVTADPEHSARMQAYRCDGMARVTAVLTEPTVTEAEAQNGWTA